MKVTNDSSSFFLATFCFLAHLISYRVANKLSPFPSHHFISFKVLNTENFLKSIEKETRISQFYLTQVKASTKRTKINPQRL